MEVQHWQIYARIRPNLDFMQPSQYDAYFSQCLGSVLDYALEIGTSTRSPIAEVWFGNLAAIPSEEVLITVRECVNQLGTVTDFLVEEQIEPEDD
jgi:hypothetical protein